MNDGCKVTEHNKEDILSFLDKNTREGVISVPMAKHTHELIIR